MIKTIHIYSLLSTKNWAIYSKLNEVQNQTIRQFVLGNVSLLFDIVHNCDNASYIIVIVISPLVVLMNDQITSLACKGVPRVTTDVTQQWPQFRYELRKCTQNILCQHFGHCGYTLSIIHHLLYLHWTCNIQKLFFWHWKGKYSQLLNNKFCTNLTFL